MRKGTIKDYLAATKTQIVRMVGSRATISSKESWLFLPQKDSYKRVCLVAHLDTFHDYDSSWDAKAGKWASKWEGDRDKIIFHDPVRGAYWSPDGLGADDRAGVFGVMSVYYALPPKDRPMVLITDGEETGGTGARDAVSKFKEHLKDVLMFIELDRRGSVDCVFYNDEPEDFIAWVSEFGFDEAIGSFSDISVIGDYTDICSVNLSIGYYGEHSSSEYLLEKQMNRTIDKTVQMVLKAHKEGKQWVLPPDSWRSRYKDTLYARGYGNHNTWGDWHDTMGYVVSKRSPRMATDEDDKEVDGTEDKGYDGSEDDDELYDLAWTLIEEMVDCPECGDWLHFRDKESGTCTTCQTDLFQWALDQLHRYYQGTCTDDVREITFDNPLESKGI